MLVIIVLQAAQDKDPSIHLVPLYLCTMVLFVLLNATVPFLQLLTPPVLLVHILMLLVFRLQPNAHNVKMGFTVTQKHCQKKLC